MAVLKIVRMGHPVLLQRAEPVADWRDPEIQRLARDMVDTMIDAEGAGLAAPQVAVPLRLIVFRCRAERVSGAPDDQALETRVLLNPEIEPVGDDMALAWEGCLSIPGMRGAVPRPRRIRYRGLGLDGGVIEAEAENFHARVVQHEVDHLDGVLYPMRMQDFRLFGFNEELARAAPAAQDEELARAGQAAEHEEQARTAEAAAEAEARELTGAMQEGVRG
jgi:peptide deformylase